jgi:hypothetical protein
VATTNLLVDLVLEGHRAIANAAEISAADRRAAIAQTSGALTGTYPEGYLKDLRQDWPVRLQPSLVTWWERR